MKFFGFGRVLSEVCWGVFEVSGYFEEIDKQRGKVCIVRGMSIKLR